MTGIDDPMIAEMQKKFTDAKVDVIVRDITSDIGIPTIAAVSDDVLLKDPSLLTIGIGTHTNARIAIMRALTEVAQSRLTQIHGAREDTITADLRKKMGTTGSNGSTGTGLRIMGPSIMKISVHMTAMTSLRISGLRLMHSGNRDLTG